VPATTDRVPGWRRCRKLLYYEYNKTGDALVKKPSFYYFNDHNPKFEESIPAMINRKTGNVEDVQKINGDDVPDEWRYAMMGVEDGVVDFGDWVADQDSERFSMPQANPAHKGQS